MIRSRNSHHTLDKPGCIIIPYYDIIHGTLGIKVQWPAGANRKDVVDTLIKRVKELTGTEITKQWLRDEGLYP